METATRRTNGVSHEESVREVEQIRHTNETINQEDALRAHTEASNIRIVTPNYKTGEKPGSDLKIGASMQELNQRLSSGLSEEADYRAERAQEHFRMQIIDPKVNSNAHLPAHAPHEFARKKLIDDFPSLHGKRSFLNLDAMKQRTMRNSRPLSTSKYLTESLDRHRDTANSKKDLDDLDRLRKSLDSLQKAAREPKELDELAELNRSLAERSRSRRAEYRLNAADDIVKTEPEALPARVKAWRSDEQQQSTTHKQAAARSAWSSRGFVKVNSTSSASSTAVQEPVRAIVRHEPPPPPPPLPIRREIVEVKREVKPKVTHTVHRVEENRRTEEVERRVVRRERRHKSTRIRHGHYGGGSQQQQFHQEHFNNNNDWNTRGLRSSSAASRNGFGGGSEYHNGFSRGPDFVDNRGYGSVGSRDASKHHQQQQQSKRVHKSYSTRDVFSDAGYGSGAYSSSGGGYGHHSNGGFYDRHHAAPLVEFPPTLPRHGAGGGFYDAPPPHHYYGGGGGAEGGRLTKSRSYADWDAGRGPFGGAMRRYDDDMARLENEFRDSLLMRVPNGNNMNEKVHRHELIPGGYETYEREVKSSGGARPSGRDGHPADFNQSSQEYNYKRETQR